MTLNRKQLCLAALLLSCLLLTGTLLLCGCSVEKAEPASGYGEEVPVGDDPLSQLETYGVAYDGEGNWTTDGNVWFASSGNLWSTDGNSWYDRGYIYPEVNEDGQTVARPYCDPCETWVTDGDGEYDGTWGEQTANYATDGNAVPWTEVHVSTVDELLDALEPGAHIYVAPGEYRLDEAAPTLRDWCYFRPTWDGGHELVLCNLSNCVIEGEGDAAEVLITQEHRSASVLVLDNCYQTSLRNVTLGHTPGAVCQGGVLHTDSCCGIYLGGCDLYGCGTVGLMSAGSLSVTLENCRIHDCSSGGVHLDGGSSFLFRDSVFDNVGNSLAVNLYECGWVEFENCEFLHIEEATFLHDIRAWQVFFDNCRIHDNRFYCLYSLYENLTVPEFNGCVFENNTLIAGEFEQPGYEILLDGELYYGSTD